MIWLSIMRAGARHHKPRQPSRPIRQPTNRPPRPYRTDFGDFARPARAPMVPRTCFSDLGRWSGGIRLVLEPLRPSQRPFPSPTAAPPTALGGAGSPLPGRPGGCPTGPRPPSQGPRAAPMRGCCLPNRFAMKPRILRGHPDWPGAAFAPLATGHAGSCQHQAPTSGTRPRFDSLLRLNAKAFEKQAGKRRRLIFTETQGLIKPLFSGNGHILDLLNLPWIPPPSVPASQVGIFKQGDMDWRQLRVISR